MNRGLPANFGFGTPALCPFNAGVELLRLQCETDPAWIDVCLRDLDAVLIDHAHCEHKAAVTALSFVNRYPEDPRLVEALADLAAEEATHLSQMTKVCISRGLTLGHPTPDPYVQALLKCTRHGGIAHQVDRLLIAGLIEGRSCERLKLLAENLPDAALAALYDELWRAEAGHHTLFIELAERAYARECETTPEYGRHVVAERLEDLARQEADIVRRLPLRAAIH